MLAGAIRLYEHTHEHAFLCMAEDAAYWFVAWPHAYRMTILSDKEINQSIDNW